MTTPVFSASGAYAGNFFVNPRDPHRDPNYHHLLNLVNRLNDEGWLCLVSIHWGKCNNVKSPQKFQQEVGREIIDSGANAIVGTSSHDFLGVEIINGCPVIYSLGDFLFDSKTRKSRPGGYINLCISDGKIDRLIFKPLTLGFCTVMDDKQQKSLSETLERWASLSADLNSSVKMGLDQAVIEL